MGPVREMSNCVYSLIQRQYDDASWFERRESHRMYPSSRGMMTQPPCFELMTDLRGLLVLQLSKRDSLHSLGFRLTQTPMRGDSQTRRCNP